jgi:hypothetical protein
LFAPDWWTNPERPDARALAGLGRLIVIRDQVGYDSTQGFGFGLYETDIDLKAEGLDSKPIKSFTFTKPPRDNFNVNGPVTTGVFAISGLPNEIIFSSVTVLPGNKINLKLKAPPGVVLRLESSTTLRDWSPLILLTNTANVLESVDTLSSGSHAMYYRAVQP